MVTIRSSSSEVSSPALQRKTNQYFGFANPIKTQGFVPLVQIDIGLLADQVGVSATDTLDLGQGIHNLLLAIDVGVQKTQDLVAFN